MLVRNAYTHDSRVEKEARTLVGAGHRVTVVADGSLWRDELKGAASIGTFIVRHLT